MRMARDWQLMNDQLRIDLLKQVDSLGLDQQTAVRLFGLVFARPQVKFVQEEILPQLDYFNDRAEGTTTFYFAGYHEPESEHEAITRVGDQNWAFSCSAFNEIVGMMEGFSKWQYSGGTDLILANARLVPHESVHDFLRCEIDLSSAVSVELSAMKAAGAIKDVASYFEEIFRYAKTQDGTDPCWGFSDRRGGRALLSALKALAISLLPKALRPEVEKAIFSAVRDLSGERTPHWSGPYPPKTKYA
jgi:hypothetical protein